MFYFVAGDKMPLNTFAGHFSESVDLVVFYVIMFYGEGCIFVFYFVAGDKMSLNTFAGHFSEVVDSVVFYVIMFYNECCILVFYSGLRGIKCR